MKKILSTLLAAAIVLSCSAFAFADGRFKDVPSTHTHYEAIEELAEHSIINGYPEGEFKPDSSITRAEFTAVLCRTIGAEAYADSLKGIITGFNDVPASHWASGYINYAYGLGVINGIGEGKFAPDEPVTYEQAIKMIVSVFDIPQEDINNHGGYPDGYLFYAKNFGFDNNVDTTVGVAINRGSVAQIIYNVSLSLIEHETERVAETTAVPSPEEIPDTTPEYTPTPRKTETAPTPSESSVYDILIAFKTQYPQGMKWDNSITYTSKYIIGYGCAAFAWILSDTAFGFDASMRQHKDFTNICVGDMIRINNNSHTVIVLEVKSDRVIIAEANYDSAVNWGRELLISNISGGHITTRYPEGYVHGTN